MTAARVLKGPDETERLHALEALGISGMRREERFDRITRLAQQLFGVERVAVTLLDRDTQWIKSDQGLDGMQCGLRSDSLFDVTIANEGLTISEDTRSDLRFARNPYVTGEPHVRFHAGHPLLASGQPVGTLCLLGDRPRRLSATEQALLAELGGWVESELSRSAEMERAAEVQRALLPRAGSLVVPGYAIAGTCVPAAAVGGDVLDWFQTPDGDVVGFLGDVMGKGIGAALIGATVRSAVRTAARQLGPPPRSARPRSPSTRTSRRRPRWSRCACAG